MNKEKQQIKIAEACGWRLFSSFDNLWAAPGHVVEYDCDAYPLPDYLNDLNAMHEAVKSIPQTIMPSYFACLCRVVSSRISLYGYSAATEATAGERAEAFLRALNLWEE